MPSVLEKNFGLAGLVAERVRGLDDPIPGFMD
jgi:hypothetical protein